MPCLALLLWDLFQLGPRLGFPWGGLYLPFQCKDVCHHAFFGRLNYNGASLLINSTWFHNDGEYDVVNNIGYFKDYDVTIKDVCDGKFDIPPQLNSRKQNKKREEQKIVADFRKHENEINHLEISKRKKNLLKENFRVFKDLKLRKLNSEQMEIVKYAEDVIEQWKNYEALIFESELELLKKKRRKREIKQSCCNQVKIRKSGTDPNFPEAHNSYFDKIYSLQSKKINNFNFYSVKSDGDGVPETIKQCPDRKAWVVGIKEDTTPGICDGSFFIPSDEICIENLPTTGWRYADKREKSGKKWPFTSLNIKVECFDEIEGKNDYMFCTRSERFKISCFRYEW